MEVKRIPIDGIDRDYMQFLHFEKESYKEILSFILLEKRKGFEFSKDNYNHFMNEFKDANFKFQIAFNSILLYYASDYYGNDEYTAVFDFDTCELVIKSEGQQA